MKLIKDKLKELASLSIDKGVHLNINHYDNGIAWSVFKSANNGEIEYISGISETAAEWLESSVQRIDVAIEKLGALKND